MIYFDITVQSMISQEKVEQLQSLLADVNSALVLLGASPSLDQVASALALSNALQLQGKQVVLASPDALSEEFSSLPGVDEVKQQLGSKNLSVSFAYQQSAVDKVSYHISDDNSTFYLVIKPQKGHEPLDAKTVQFDYTGADADMIFLVGVHQYDALEHLYTGYEQLYEQAAVVTLHTFEPSIGHVKLDVSGSTSLSEGAAGLLKKLGYQIDGDAATNLLAGIEQGTQSFKSLTTTADTFEVVAHLMRSGARRLSRVGSELKNHVNQKEPTVVASDGVVSSIPREIPQVKPKKAKTTKAGGLDHQPGEGSLLSK